MADQRKILIMQAHNLGDAVISTALVETIGRGLPGARIDVVTRPEIKTIFAHHPFVDRVFTARFPMGSMHDFGPKDALALTRLIAGLRRQRYTDVVNLAGDFREEMLGYLLSPEHNWTPQWSQDHPCSHVIRRSVVRLANRPVCIPRDKPNIYEAASILGTAVGGVSAEKSALYTPAKRRIVWAPVKRTVGIHPMASQPWRRWELDRWRHLAQILILRDMDIRIFGAPSELDRLREGFASCEQSRLRIVTGSLSDYFSEVSKVQVLLCHDSFASHVAYALGVPIIFLNGANDAEAWAPPGSVIFGAGPGLACYPCYNRPTCIGKSKQFACIGDIEVDQVVEAVWEALKEPSLDRPNFPGWHSTGGTLIH
jgi:ADP-heptose:LPS heptosyltransferase